MTRRLKWLRVALAALVAGGLTAALVDFRELVPAHAGHVLASIQFVPSAVALATGAAVAHGAAAVVVLILTLLFGRVYCSTLCPLGVYQDLVARVAGWFRRGRKSRLPFSEPVPWLRHLLLWATLAGVAAGWGGLLLALLDPYSVFGRMAVDLFRPLVTAANNLAVGPASALGVESLYRVPVAWAGIGALAVPVSLAVVVTAMAALRGRLYCNTVCPVGTWLGLVSRVAAFRISIDKESCRKCALCLGACKAQCIDLRSGTVDFDRCVGCFNCMTVCEDAGIGYRWSWRKAARPAEPAEVPESLVEHQQPAAEGAPQTRALDRREFLAGTAGALAVSVMPPPLSAADGPTTDDGKPWPGPEARAGICPPGAGSVDRYLDRCTACHLCVSSCPTHVLQPAFLEFGWSGLMKPRLDYARSFCNFECVRCAEVCPDGAITLRDLAEKKLTRLGTARLLEKLCVVVDKGTDCAACSEHCPTKAVETVPYRDNLRLPKVRPELCIGCGACEYSCPVRPVKAIVVFGERTHTRAEKAIDEKIAPPATEDFPF